MTARRLILLRDTLLAAVFLGMGLPASAAVAQTSLTLEPCRVPGVEEEVRCGTYEVWEDRDARSGRRIPLRVVLIPARDSDPLPDPVVILQGGPGSSNVASAANVARFPLRDRRAILLVDLRGTGESGALGCDFGGGPQGHRADFFPMAGIIACRDSLARRTDLSKYTGPIVMDDLAEVVRALGITQVNLRGVSGGTRQALEFIRRHPDLARSALLEGPVPMDARIPLTFAQDAQEALDGVIADCAAEPACAERFPRLPEQLPAVLERLNGAAESVWARDPRTGDSVSVPVTTSAVAQVVRSILYQPNATRLLPLAIDRAVQGDWSPLADRLRTLGVPAGISIGFYLSATCAEDLPWFSEAEAEPLARGTYLGMYRVRQQKAACAEWPRGELPPSHLDPVRTDVPILILVGEHDPVTPPRWGQEIVQHLSRGRVIVVRGGGHSFSQESLACLDRIRVEFLDTVAPERLDTGCLVSVRRQPFHLVPPA